MIIYHDFFVKWLVRACALLLPFGIVLIPPFYSVGLDTCLYFIFLPVGFSCFALWIFSEKKDPLMGFLVVALIWWLAVRGALSVYGISWIELGRLIAMFGIALAISETEYDLKWLLRIITVTAILEFLYIFPFRVQWVHIATDPGTHWLGTFSHENRLSFFYLSVMPACFYVLVKDTLPWKRLAAVGMALSFIALFFCGSRAGRYLGLFELIILPIGTWAALSKNIFRVHVSGVFRKCIPRIVRKVLIPSFILCAVLQGIFLYTAWNKRETFQKFSSWYGEERVGLVKASWEMFKDHPLVGIGAGRFGQVLGTGQEHPHNEVMHNLAEYGVIGFILSYGIIIHIFWIGACTPYFLTVIIVLIMHSFVGGMRTPEQSMYFGLFTGIILRNMNLKEE